MVPSWPFSLTHGKVPRQPRQNAVMLGGTLVCIASLCFAGRALANPLGEKIKFGSAEFLRNGTKLDIQQSSKTLILDWSEFSIQEGEVTRFLQPASSSVAVNRVLGGNLSELYGSLKANGQIYLINPNGVFIGRSGRVDAAGFAASTLDASDEQFMKGGEIRFQGDSDASVVNLGSIHALDGDVHLIAKTVENHGSIKAPNGTVGLFGGTDLLLQPEGDETLGVSIASGPGKSVNTGRIAAAQAELKAAGGNLYALAIQNSGVIRATGVHHKGGRVLLRATSGTIENSGTIATKTGKGAGGRIVLGSAGSLSDLTERSAKVAVVNRGSLDASGSRGGVIEIDAETVSLEASSRILAIGTAGSGGDVAIRGSQSIMSTQGGLVDASGLRGGSVELSGGKSINFAGELMANGSDGAGGSMRIDASSVTIGSGVLDASGATGGVIGITGDNISIDRTSTFAANGADGGGRLELVATSMMQFDGSISAVATSPGARGGMAEVSGFGSLDYKGSTDLRSSFGPAGTLLLDPADFTIDNATAAVITHNLLTSSVVIATSPAGAGNGDIFINAPLIFSGANDLTLLAHRHIAVNASVQNGGSGDINLVAGWDGLTGSTEAAFELFASTPSSFGNQLGTIAIGNGSQSAGVAVGSRNGMTSAAAFGMVVTGGDTSSNAFARIGFSRDITSEIQNAAGPIQITLKGNLIAAGGGASSSYAQIGHDGRSVGGTFQGAISIRAAGAVQLTGGGNFAYAQVGHGGGGSQSNQSGMISIDANSLSIAGGVASNAYAQVGHGDSAGGSSGNRAGRIDVRVVGETTLINGSASTASWMIGHRTSSSAAVTNSPVNFAVGALDYNASALASEVSLSQDFVGKFAQNLAGGDVTVEARGPGRLIVDGNFDYSSSHRLTLLASNSADVNASVVNRGEGEIVLVVDAANSSRPVYNSAASLQITPGATLSSGGAVRLFATEPARTQLGGFTPALRHYNIWFGDAGAVNGVNFKFQPTLTLATLDVTKTYGQSLSSSQLEFTITGLQPGDSLAQILLGTPQVSSLGTGAAAGVSGNPYQISFADGLSVSSGYALQLVHGSLTVTPAALTLTARNQSKVYGNTFNFNGTEFTSLGLVNGDVVNSVSLSSAGAVATAGVDGSPYAITASNAAGSGLGNYTIGYLPGALSVTPATLTLTARSQTKVYGNALNFNGTEFTSLGLVEGDAVNSVSLSSAGAVATAGVGGSPYAITASNAAGSGLGNYTISYLPGALSVTPATLTLTARSQTKVYGNALNFNGTEFTSLGLVEGDAVNSVSLSSAGAVATAGVDGSPYAITASNAAGSGLGNYTIGYLPGALSVTPATLTLTARSQTKVYGNALNFNGTEFTSLGLVEGDAVNSVSLSSAGAVATAGVDGSPYAITASNAAGSGLGNYTISYLPGALSVTPATLTLTARSQTKVYGNALNFNGTEFTSLGLVEGDAVNSVSLSSAGAVATAGVDGSPYAITASNAAGSGLGNYTISYLPGALSVTPATLTLTARSQTKVYGNALNFNGTEFTSLGLVEGDAVNSVSLSSAGAVATAGVDGSPYAITASNAAGSGLGNYTISYLPGALSVTPATLTLTARSQTKVYGNALNFNGTEFTSLGLVEGDAVNSVSLSSAGAVATAGVDGSPYAITASNAAGSGLGNYTIGYLPGALSVTPATLTLTARSQTKVYGNALNFNGTEFTSLGLVEGDAVNSVSLSSAGAVATAGVGGSPYAITASNAAGSGLGNYTIGYLPGALSVTPATLTLTARSQTKVYGNALNFNGTEFTSLGLVEGDAVNSVSLSSAGAVATAGVDGSPYAITASNAAGSGLGNYTIGYLPGALSVTPATLTLTARSQTKVYGNALNFNGTEFTSLGLVEGDAVNSVSLSSAGAVATAGVDGSPYAITASNAAGSGLGNYTIGYLPGALSVTPATLTLTARSQTKVYGNALNFNGTEFTSLGLVEGDAVNSVSLSSAGAVATAGVGGSPYAITASSATGSGLGNYTIGYLPGALSVTPAALTLTALNQTKVYGNTLNFNGTEFASVGLVNGDVVNSVSLGSAGAIAAAGVGGSPYAIAASNAAGSGLGNYTIAYLPGALSVTPAALTLTALNQSKVYGNRFNFNGTEFTSLGLQNGEIISLVDLASTGTAPTAGVAAGPYAITIANPQGANFNPANYALVFRDGSLEVEPARLVITAHNQRKPFGTQFEFAGTEFSVRGLQNSETVGLVTLSSLGSPASAGDGQYAIGAANARGGTYDAANYEVSYAAGILQVLPPPPEPPPVVTPAEVQKILAVIEQTTNLASRPASEPPSGGDEPSAVSTFGIQRPNLTTFFGEQLLEPGGALMIDQSGVGPPLPIGEAPQNLEAQLADEPHDALEEAIAEDDRRRKLRPRTRLYDLAAGEVFTADKVGEVTFQLLRAAPEVLRQATDEGIESRLLQAATNP